MKPIPPDSSRSLDALWEAPDEDEEDLPPALAPSLQGKHVPQEDRDTLIPPVPPAEYVETMMKLGELDEPTDHAPPAFSPPPSPPPPTRPFGLVMAQESELLLENAGGAPRRRTTASFAAVRPAPAAAPRPSIPKPFQGGVPRSEGGAARAHALPVPRAPSVNPEPDPEVETVSMFEDLDTIEGLDSLDGLDPFFTDDPSGVEGLPTPTPPGPPVALFEEHRRPTPPALSAPSSSKPVPTSLRKVAAVPAGFRLGKRTPLPTPSEPFDAALLPGPVSEPPPSSLQDRAREMAALFEANNYSSALVLAESVLVGDPNHAEARRCAEACREALTEKYLGSLGGRRVIPRVAMGPEEIRFLSLDHRSGFLLSSIDGSMTVEEVLDVSSMPELDALRIMFELRNQGVIEIVEPSRRPGRR